MGTKSRLDSLLVDRGFYPSRTAAARAVRAGEVRLDPDGPVALKPGDLVDEAAAPIVATGQRFVSRGGEKLANALDALGLDPGGLDCLDVGASTGGFTDCLLQRGARRVAAVDVGYGLLEDSLRRDPRVVDLPRVNARELRADHLELAPELATVDLSFIALGKVLPAVAGVLSPSGEVLAMVKPQFELGRGRVGRGGVVRDPELRREAILGVCRAAGGLGLAVCGFASSGLPGPKGNRETFVHLSRERQPLTDPEAALEEVRA